MTTNKDKRRKRSDSLERVVTLDYGIKTEAEDLTEQFAEDLGDCRYMMTFEHTVEFSDNEMGSAVFISEEELTACEVHILRELLRKFRLMTVSVKR